MTARVPSAPDAPGWFSTTTGWPHLALRFCAMMRAITSVPPPAANGTIILMAWSRYSPALAGSASAPSNARAVAIRTSICISPVFFLSLGMPLIAILRRCGNHCRLHGRQYAPAEEDRIRRRRKVGCPTRELLQRVGVHDNATPAAIDAFERR